MRRRADFPERRVAASLPPTGGQHCGLLCSPLAVSAAGPSVRRSSPRTDRSVQRKAINTCAVMQSLVSSPPGSASLLIEPNVSELTLQTGDSVRFSCSGDRPVTWKVTSRGQKKHLQENGTVKIDSAKYTDTGTYICAYQDANSTESKSIHVFVQDASNFWHTVKFRISVQMGTDAVLPCLITDPSVPLSDILLIAKRSHREIAASFDAKKGFTIHNVQLHDKDKYVCVANVNGSQKSSNEMELVVSAEPKEPPTVTMSPIKHLRIPGEVFKLTCTITNNVGIANTRWEHNAKDVTSMSTTDVSFSGGTFTGVSTLRVPNIQFNDSGEYTCIGANSKGSHRISASLEVIEKPFVNITTLQKTRVSLHMGDSVALTVYIEAYPDIFSWKWEHVTADNILNVSSKGNLKPYGEYRSESSLVLNRIKKKEAGTYTFYASNSKANGSLSFKVIVYSSPKVEMSSTDFNSTHILTCTATGNPRPTFQWFQCSSISCRDEMRHLQTGEETKAIDENTVESYLTLNNTPHNTTILCIASNIAGNSSAQNVFANTVLTVTSNIENPLFNPVLIAMAGVGIFLLLLSSFLFYKYQKKPKYEVRWQIVKVSGDNQYICIDPTQLPYNDKWEFPRANLHFGKTLGAGAFGQVMEAKAIGLGKDEAALKVAVKMLKSSAHSDEVEALMSELKILSHLGNHQNIVNLLGACTQGGPILVITEYCRHGDLLNFLRRKAEAMNDMFTPCLSDFSSNYKNISVEQKYVRSDSGFGSEGNSGYVDMKPVMPNKSARESSLMEEEEDNDDHLPLDLHDLLNFSLQVAQGMSFLASKNCIHRDVAARNVLITQGRVAKICDFGLARDIENDINYVVKGNARLPVKWMAPESIFDCIYTVQSDVWSYGILLWEIFSLGRSPYPGIVVNQKFYKMIKEGYKMDSPDSAPLDIYRLMKACWDLEPTKRPNFNQITDLINRQMSLITDQDYANIISGKQEEDCEDPKCVDVQQPLITGNNYQFC
ncbi:macrophage colony-stimulating factor 1 receptor [Gastrophryne carolinensis]